MNALTDSVGASVSTSTMVAPVKEPDGYLTIDGALEEMRRLGFDVTFRQVQRYAYEKKLPFFRLGKALHIQRSELLHHLKKLQLAAVRELAAAR